jgi:hypothetical protein
LATLMLTMVMSPRQYILEIHWLSWLSLGGTMDMTAVSLPSSYHVTKSIST